MIQIQNRSSYIVWICTDNSKNPNLKPRNKKPAEGCENPNMMKTKSWNERFQSSACKTNECNKRIRLNEGNCKRFDNLEDAVKLMEFIQGGGSLEY